MVILIAILAATLGLIFVSSYFSITNENYKTLTERSEAYKECTPGAALNTNKSGKHLKEKALAELETFYCVMIDADGNAEVVDNGASSVYSDEELKTLALEAKDRSGGKTIGSLLYLVTDQDDCTIVSFMDNSLFTESFSAIFRNMMLFGLISIIILFFVARYLAGRIVTPMEKSYFRQKQFTSDAEHELKTPIAAVSANADLLKREIGENQWLDNIIFENFRMKELITELLELSRNENTIPPKEPLDLSHLVNGATLPLEATAFDKSITLCSRIQERVTICGNKRQLEQLVTILADNALSHTIPTGTSPAVVSVSLSTSRGSAVLTVSNPGKAIPEEEKEKLFERFYRNDSAHAFTGHYGLGLAIAKSIIDSHNGNISVECGDGLVSFTARLPLQ